MAATSSPRRRWDNFVCGSICFFLGAGIVYSLMNYSLMNRISLGPLKLRYFNENEITAAFHKQYHNDWWNRTVLNTRWLGAPTMQTPLDMWIFQEIIHETKPDVLLETGTYKGGGAFYYATMFDIQRKGKVLTIDIEDIPGKPKHDRIQYFIGSSTDPGIVDQMKKAIAPGERTMVVLDSDHEKSHVLRELKAYAPLVCKGCYLVVQDTHLNGHPIHVEFSPGPGKQGPMEAVQEFLAENQSFEVDHSREKYGLTFNPGGWLKRVN